mmetsp:Transcript_15965/g.43510  ORF Transcript_15965/g.43510 Transcript_15965/m.43510 type:complete len:125 (+) Transcript_15965:597-971(+)
MKVYVSKSPSPSLSRSSVLPLVARLIVMAKAKMKRTKKPQYPNARAGNRQYFQRTWKEVLMIAETSPATIACRIRLRPVCPWSKMVLPQQKNTTANNDMKRSLCVKGSLLRMKKQKNSVCRRHV